MIVKDLIKLLKELDQKSEVYLQIDQEGNGYNLLYGVDDECVIVGEDVFSSNWSADEACMEEDEWEEVKKGNKIVVMYP